MSSNYSVTICGKKYEVLDCLNNITMADSFVKNKIGSGHGEAKLYVGNEGPRLLSFFDDLEGFSGKFFVLKSDFEKYLLDAKDEFMNPEQEYLNKDSFPEVYSELIAKVSALDENPLYFDLDRSTVAPPRVYLTSKSEFYMLIRELGLPNISYLSILKLKDENTDKIIFYARLFVDYKPDIIKYESPLISSLVAEINGSNRKQSEKDRLIQARIGQGEYRMKLIEECQFCPFTMVNDERLLIASHIKPWAKSNDKEKIDPKNGFALTPTYDKLFDGGFISFTDDKKLIVSPWISPMNQKRLEIYNGKLIEKLQLDDERRFYLEYHRKNIFKM